MTQSYLKSGVQELLEAVTRAGGCIEPHLLSESAVAASAIAVPPPRAQVRCNHAKLLDNYIG